MSSSFGCLPYFATTSVGRHIGFPSPTAESSPPSSGLTRLLNDDVLSTRPGQAPPNFAVILPT